MHLKTLCVVLPLACAGCAAAPVSAPPPSDRLVLQDSGFGVAGTGMEIGFGRTQEGAITAAAKLIGRNPAEIDTNGACTFARWRGGPTMVFRNRAFVGWIANGSQAGDTCQ